MSLGQRKCAGCFQQFTDNAKAAALIMWWWCQTVQHSVFSSFKADTCMSGHFPSLPSLPPHEHQVSRSQCRTASSWLSRWRGWCSMGRLQDSSGKSSLSVSMLLQSSRARQGLTTRYLVSATYCSHQQILPHLVFLLPFVAFLVNCSCVAVLLMITLPFFPCFTIFFPTF